MKKNDYAPIIIGKLINIGGILQWRANKLLLPFHLNQQQFSILYEIEKAGQVNQKSMVNRLVLEKAHVSKVIKKLSGMGLVKVTVSQEDRRSSWLSITSRGREVTRQCADIFAQWNREWISELNADQLEHILEYVNLLQNIYKKHLQKG